MVHTLFAVCLALLLCRSVPCLALDMDVRTIEASKTAYVNLWGPIVPGDAKKFGDLVLPHVRSGYAVMEITIFSKGGNVAEAMEIGRQIRALQSKTVTSFFQAQIINNKVVRTGKASCTFNGTYGQPPLYGNRTVIGADWCDCVGACVFVWVAGVSRLGGRIGVQRPDERLGNLTPTEARLHYKAAQEKYSTYLRSMDVPTLIVDQIFMVSSQSIKFLDNPEILLLRSAPSLEEVVLSKCGASKEVQGSPANRWTFRGDAKHDDCSDGVLRELAQDGARVYLQKYAN